MVWSENITNIEFISSYKLEVIMRSICDQIIIVNGIQQLQPWFAIECKFLLNHSVPSICDILCPKRKNRIPVCVWVSGVQMTERKE